MKNIILSFTILFLYTACETGTKYEQNKTVEQSVKKVKEDTSIRDLVEGIPSAQDLVKKSYIEEKESTIDKKIAHKYDPENPLNGDSFVEDSNYIEETPAKEESFKSENISNGLKVKSIRVGYHDTYTRLVFDVTQNGEKAKKVGNYSVNYEQEENIIFVTLDGYSRFSAKIPNFSTKSVVEKIYFDQSTFNFSIKLRDSATVKSYDYKNPARLIIDIRPN